MHKTGAEIHCDSRNSRIKSSSSEPAPGFKDHVVDIILRESNGCSYACSSCADDDDVVDSLQLAGDECGKE